MNDNKRLYYKLNTYFWWILACFPLVLLLFNLIWFAFNKNSLDSNFVSKAFNNVSEYFNVIINGGFFNNFVNSINDLFISFFGISNDYLSFISFVLVWFVIAHFLHLVVDFILILPRVAQKFIERL